MRTTRWAASGRTGGPHQGPHEYRAACDWSPKCVDYDPDTVRPVAPDDLVPDPVAPEWAADYRPPPTHYQGDGIDPWQIWEAFDLDPWSAALVKYILRSGKKPGESKLKDLLKARDYLAYLIEREEGKNV